MSVIFGIFKRKGSVVENSAIRLMDKSLSYWDADDIGKWREGSVFLGHRMLWNTPESKLENLPHVSKHNKHTFVITIDARLDNRDILVEQLEMSNLPLEKITDSSLVLAAYQKWGQECPKYLLGDFVFVIWDENKQQLFCVRDHIGIKPFYYYLNDELFIFSNDIRGLISNPQINKKYNDRAISIFLQGDFGFFDKKDTFFKEIKKLSAAKSITITGKYASESAYWDIDDISKIHYNTYEEYVKKLKELFSDAVKVRLRTSYPVVSHLSGGIDSSSIAVVAARELKKRKQLLYAFNWIEAPVEKHDPTYSEWGFATQLVKLENIEQKDIKLTAEFIADLYDKIDITIDDITYFWDEYLVREEVEKYKARSILSGWGGDELISSPGYSYLSGLFRQGHFTKAIKKIFLPYKNTNKKFIYLRVIKKSIRELIYPIFYKRMSGFYQEYEQGYDPFEFTQDKFSISAKDFFLPDIKFQPGVHNDQKYLFNSGHIQHRIENWASSAINKKIEYSYPLLDKRLVEFSLAVPEDLFDWTGSHPRHFFRSAISDYLPNNIAWAAKNSEPERRKAWIKLWEESLKVWMQKNEYISENQNYYVDRYKIINSIKKYFIDKENGIDDETYISGVISSILLLNLKNSDGYK